MSATFLLHAGNALRRSAATRGPEAPLPALSRTSHRGDHGDRRRAETESLTQQCGTKKTAKMGKREQEARRPPGGTKTAFPTFQFSSCGFPPVTRASICGCEPYENLRANHRTCTLALQRNQDSPRSARSTRRDTKDGFGAAKPASSCVLVPLRLGGQALLSVRSASICVICGFVRRAQRRSCSLSFVCFVVSRSLHSEQGQSPGCPALLSGASAGRWAQAPSDEPFRFAQKTVAPERAPSIREAPQGPHRLAVVVAKEHVLAIVAALGDVVRGVGDNGSCEPGHVAMIPRPPLMSTENLVTVPIPGCSRTPTPRLTMTGGRRAKPPESTQNVAPRQHARNPRCSDATCAHVSMNPILMKTSVHCQQLGCRFVATRSGVCMGRRAEIRRVRLSVSNWHVWSCTARLRDLSICTPRSARRLL